MTTRAAAGITGDVPTTSGALSRRLNPEQIVRRACDEALMYTAAIEAGAHYSDGRSGELAQTAAASWSMPSSVAAARQRSDQVKRAVDETAVSVARTVGRVMGEAFMEQTAALALAIAKLAQVTDRTRSETVADLIQLAGGEA